MLALKAIKWELLNFWALFSIDFLIFRTSISTYIFIRFCDLVECLQKTSIRFGRDNLSEWRRHSQYGLLHRLPTSVLIISILSRKWMWKLAVVPFNEFKMHISLSLSWSSVSFHENACGNWQLFRLMNLRCSRCLIYGQCAFLGLAKPSELQCRCFLIWTARCKLRLWWMFPL